MKDTDREENADPRKDHISRRKCLKVNIRAEILREKYLNIHQPYALAKRVGKCTQDIYSRGDPFCESVITILRFAECRDFLSKDGEDSLGRMT